MKLKISILLLLIANYSHAATNYIGGRPAALGFSFTAIADSPYSIIYNPASLDTILNGVEFYWYRDADNSQDNSFAYCNSAQKYALVYNGIGDKNVWISYIPKVIYHHKNKLKMYEIYAGTSIVVFTEDNIYDVLMNMSIFVRKKNIQFGLKMPISANSTIYEESTNVGIAIYKDNEKISMELISNNANSSFHIGGEFIKRNNESYAYTTSKLIGLIYDIETHENEISAGFRSALYGPEMYLTIAIHVSNENIKWYFDLTYTNDFYRDD